MKMKTQRSIRIQNLPQRNEGAPSKAIMGELFRNGEHVMIIEE
jgi:hypothetical protein